FMRLAPDNKRGSLHARFGALGGIAVQFVYRTRFDAVSLNRALTRRSSRRIYKRTSRIGVPRMNTGDRSTAGLARNVRRLGHLDLAGGGQVTIHGSHAFVGHLPNPDHLGTSIIDIADPRQPRVVATITLDDHESHSHKVRAVGDIMIVNHERNMSKLGRRAEQLPAARRALTEELARKPTRSEIAAKMSVTEDDLAALEKFEQRRYANGGFKIYNVSKPSQPQLICYQKTGGIGVHRFDMDGRRAYISTEMEGYVGNILVIYDLRDPRKPQEVSRW